MRPASKRAPFVALTTLLSRRWPDDDPDALVAAGRVLVDGRPALNPAARVRADASVRVLRPKPLRGELKLGGALRALDLDVAGRVAVDVGAAAGGFTSALLAAGAARVHAVDAGHGQLLGRLRADPRVVILERVNLGDLDRTVVPDMVDVVTMDLSYLPLADAVPQLDRLRLAQSADLVALVKPTFELRAAVLAADPEQVDEAVDLVAAALLRHGWDLSRRVPSPLPGSRGAVEAFVHARRGRGR